MLRCRLFGWIVSFFVSLSHSQILTALCHLSLLPTRMPSFSAFAEKETRALGHREGQTCGIRPGEAGSPGPTSKGPVVCFVPWLSGARFLHFPEFPMQYTT